MSHSLLNIVIIISFYKGGIQQIIILESLVKYPPPSPIPKHL